MTTYNIRTDGPMLRPDLPHAHDDAHALLSKGRSESCAVGLLDVLSEVLAQDGTDYQPAALYAACELLVRVHDAGGGVALLRAVVSGDRLGPMYPQGDAGTEGVALIRAAMGMAPVEAPK